ATSRVAGASARRFSALHELEDQMRSFTVARRDGQAAISATRDAVGRPRLAVHVPLGVIAAAARRLRQRDKAVAREQPSVSCSLATSTEIGIVSRARRP